MADYERKGPDPVQLATGLGWFSLALGVAELTAPGGLARLIGVRPSEQADAALRGCGAREIATGLAILAQPERSRWLWARVAGDAIDLGTLGAAMSRDETDRGRAGFATAAVLGVTALDVLCAQQLARQDGRPQRDRRRHVQLEQVTTINKPIDEVYRFWRNVENFPRFMRHLESVELLGGNRSCWRAHAPAGMTVQWEAELLQDRENEWIAWRSVEGSQIENSGSVRFQRAPGARGTEVRVQLEYDHCIDAVGMEGHSPGVAYAYDKMKTMRMMETDRPVALRQAILACRSGGTISVAGVYGGFIDKFPMGAIVNRSLTIKSGQTHVHRYMRPLLERVERGEIDPTFIITHRLRLDDAPHAYDIFSDKEDECLKVVLKP